MEKKSTLGVEMNQQRKILIVDDNESIHEDFKKVLSTAEERHVHLLDLENQLFGKEISSTKELQQLLPNYVIESAFLGQEAIAMVERAAAEKNPYALVFVDVKMPPGIDGIETIRGIWEKVPNTEAVLCTAHSDYSNADLVEKLGVTDRLLFLKKPFEPSVIRQMALSLTTKWLLGNQVSNTILSLEEAVTDRTRQLTNLVHEVTSTNQKLQVSLSQLRETQNLLLHSSKMSAIGEMAAGIAHEVNNPLAIIHLVAGQIRDALLKEPVDKAELGLLTDKIEATTLRIGKIIHGLHSFAADNVQEPLKKTSIKRIVDDVIELSSERFKNAGITLTVLGFSDLLVSECRPIQIAQVLLNLLNNAHNAVISLPEKWVKLRVTEAESHIEFAVLDSGKGIPQEIAERIFHPFFTTKGATKGMGLGLSISSQILKSHSGTISTDVEDGHTRFIVRLPKLHPKQSQ